MNRRQKNKIKRAVIQIELLKSVDELDKELFPDLKRKPHYKVRMRHLSYHDAVTIKRINNLKIEVREDEQNHGRPHFHVTLNKNEKAARLRDVRKNPCSKDAIICFSRSNFQD